MRFKQHSVIAVIIAAGFFVSACTAAAPPGATSATSAPAPVATTTPANAAASTVPSPAVSPATVPSTVAAAPSPVAAAPSPAAKPAASPAPSPSPVAAAAAAAAAGPVFTPACTPAAGKTFQVALIVAQGGLGDQSYNDLAYAGLQKAQQDFPLVPRVIQSADIVSQGRALLQQAGQSNFDLVIDLEFSTADALKDVAPTFPKTQWMIVNLPSESPNVTGYLFNEQDGSFLAGALAAITTTKPSISGINPDKVIGAIGGAKSPGIDKFIVGYIQGARAVEPDIKVLTSYANSFGDPAKGKELADSMFSQGADIVYQIAGGTGAGIIQSAQQSGHFAIGVDTDQDALAPGRVLTSMIKRTDYAVYDSINRMVCGTLKGGDTVTLGLKEGAVGLSPMKFTRDLLTDADMARVEQFRQDIIAGRTKVWNVIDQGNPDWFQ